jgi:HEAT repeat protein
LDGRVIEAPPCGGAAISRTAKEPSMFTLKALTLVVLMMSVDAVAQNPAPGPLRPSAGVGPPRGGGPAVPARLQSRNRLRDDSYSDWRVWWEIREDAFVGMRRKAALKSLGASNADPLFPPAPVFDSPRRADFLHDDVEPALLAASNDPSWRVQAAAAVALGRVAEPDRVDVRTRLTELLQSEHADVREGAVVGLGLLGAAESVPDLLALFREPTGNRAAAGDGATRLRVLAALSVGLIGARRPEAVSPEAAAALLAGARDKNADADVSAAAVLALGRAHAVATAPALKEIAADVSEDARLRSAALAALGKFGDRGAVNDLRTNGLADRESLVRRTAATALGELGDPADEATVDALAKLAREDADRGVRNGATVALGRLGGPRARAALIERVKNAPADDRPFAGLALGVDRIYRADEATDADDTLRTAFLESKSNSERAAFALALGLRALSDTPNLLDEAGPGAAVAFELAFAFATARGLAPVPLTAAVRNKLRDELRSTFDWRVRRGALNALGMRRDAGAVGAFRDALLARNGESRGYLEIAGSLANLRDTGVATALIVASRGAGFDDGWRTFASAGLGVLCDKDDVSRLVLLDDETVLLSLFANGPPIAAAGRPSFINDQRLKP